VVDWILTLPLAYYAGFVRQHAYDLSNQTFSKWLGDSVKGLGVGIVAFVLFAWLPYLLIEKSPRRWWLYTGLAVIPFLVLGMLVAPIWIDPLFNDFGPMQDEELEAAILATAERAGIEGGRVFEVDKSVDTNAVNAYVTGFGGTQRIVLWDTIIAKLGRDELLFVMGHEMGHYALHHVVWGLLFGSLGALVALYLLYRTAGWCVARWGGRCGFGELHDFASLPLALLLLGLFGLVLTPPGLAFSRFQEHEADRFALELTQDNHAGAMAFVQLQGENLGNPRPGLLSKIWRSTHPPLGERIDFCNDYRPWETGGPLRYAHLFAP
jgi:Zn-dependent protease with chaperone function